MAIHARSPVQNVRIKHLNDSKRFIEHSDTMNDIAIILMIITQQGKEKF